MKVVERNENGEDGDDILMEEDEHRYLNKNDLEG